MRFPVFAGRHLKPVRFHHTETTGAARCTKRKKTPVSRSCLSTASAATATRGAIWSLPSPAIGGSSPSICLPGHGDTPAEADSGTFDGLVRSLEAFLAEEDLADVDMVGSSLGGRLALETARRGHAGAAVALDPGGFWKGWERSYVRSTLLLSVGLLRGIGDLRGRLARNPISRSVLLAQLSAHPWKLDGENVRAELDSYAHTSTFTALVNDLAAAPMQDGPAAPISGPVAIGWGRHDRLCWPIQAARARCAFLSAQLHWFEHSGHFPHWDEPQKTSRFIETALSPSQKNAGT